MSGKPEKSKQNQLKANDIQEDLETTVQIYDRDGKVIGRFYDVTPYLEKYRREWREEEQAKQRVIDAFVHLVTSSGISGDDSPLKLLLKLNRTLNSLHDEHGAYWIISVVGDAEKKNHFVFLYVLGEKTGGASISRDDLVKNANNSAVLDRLLRSCLY